MAFKELYLPEKNMPSTHAKATSLSANDVELHMGQSDKFNALYY